MNWKSGILLSFMMYVPSQDDLSKSCTLLRETIEAHGGLQRGLSVQEFVIRAKTGGIALPLRFQDRQFNAYQQGKLRHMFSLQNIFYIRKAIRQPEGDWLPRKKGGWYLYIFGLLIRIHRILESCEETVKEMWKIMNIFTKAENIFSEGRE